MFTRTIKIPVAKILEGGTPKEFYVDLRQDIKKCVAATNRCLAECLSQDKDAYEKVSRGEPIPKQGKIYPYPVLAGQFKGCASVQAALARNAWKVYVSKRWDILNGRCSLPTQRNCSVPLLSNKSTRNLNIETDDDGNLIANFSLLTGKKYKVQLRGGSNYRLPLNTIKKAVSVGDSKIWLQKVGGKEIPMLGLACKLEPSEDNCIKDGCLTVRIARESFIVAMKTDADTPFTVNADHVRSWQNERNRKQQRLRQDRKSGHTRQQLIKIQNKVSKKYCDRVNSFIQETVAHIVDYARRRKVASLEYDGTIKSYFGTQFPYYKFCETLKNKCENVGLSFCEITNDIHPAELDEPHVYFLASVNNGKFDGKVKIGMTGDKKGTRKKTLENAGGQELIVLATHKTAKSNLRKIEKQYHAQFAHCRVMGEWFKLESIVDWLREVRCLGNAGNLSQILQYMET